MSTDSDAPAALRQSGITVRVARDLDELDAKSWDSLCRPDDYFHADYLRALSRSGLDCSFRFLLAEEAGSAVGLAFGYTFAPPVAGPLRIRVFSTGSPTDIGFPFVVRPGTPAEPVLAALGAAMVAEARRSRAAGLLLRDVVHEEEVAGHEHTLARLGFRRFPLFAEAVLPIAWACYDDYLQALRKRYRQNIRRNAAQVEAAGFTLEVLPGPEAVHLAGELQPLWLQVFRRHPEEWDQLLLPVAYFQEILALPGTVLLLLRHQGRLVAFDQLMANGSVLDSKFCGRDYERLGREPVGHMLIAETIRYACDHGFALLSFGISNESVKSRFGCTFRVVHGYRRPIALAMRLARTLRLEQHLVRGYDVASAADDDSRGHVFRD
ncbi:GNAT family N-acetyltransferase [Streptacidiphilus sp. EB129]|uniref:GNAT family N-acetyltransferase n=1 Tax=Streptacidiphilus sp. EB129 TaxID=3156262 RepID=UPI0035187089